MRKISVLLLLLLSSLLFFPGCGKNEKPLKVDHIRIIQGADQSALFGEKFPQTIKIELLGAPQRGIAGGKASSPVVPGGIIRVVPKTPGALTVSSGNLICDANGALTLTADRVGVVNCEVTAGDQFGDQYLRIFPVGNEKKALELRFTVGVKIEGGDQEVSTGGTTVDPLSVTLLNPDGSAAAKIPVYFNAVSAPDGNTGKVRFRPASPVLTGEDGKAETFVTVGNSTGEYNVNIEVADGAGEFFLRGKTVRVMGLNLWSVVIAVIGGLTLFLLGMKMMSDGLQRVAGDSMKRVIQFFARNRLVAVIAGTLVTAVVQSSSATTVMVIGFINAGLLSLQQAIGIIFGANIGTTVTAQIISFDIGGIALPAITIGFVVSLLGNEKARGWGETMLGFGLLFFGLLMMSGELKTLGTFPRFIEFFKTFDCAPVSPGGTMPLGAIIGAIAAGTILTIIIQSSSATIGIVLALAAGNLINFYTAVPLLLGSNIGTTITAMLASLAANRVAKQAALCHTLVKLVGTTLLVATFYITYKGYPMFLYFVDWVTAGEVFAEDPQNLERHIAMAHTMFNVGVVIVLFPFIPTLAKICQAILPIKTKEEAAVRILEPHLLATPAIALEQAVKAIRDALKLAWTMTDRVVNKEFLTGKYDKKLAKDLMKKEESVDQARSDITDYLMRITRRELTIEQSELVPLLMHCNNDVERIADHTENILALTERMVKEERKLTESDARDIKKLWEVLNSQAQDVIRALGSPGHRPVERALRDERRINKLAKRMEDEHIQRLRKGAETFSMSVIFIEMLGEMEKIGDHLYNIAERAPEIQRNYFNLK